MLRRSSNIGRPPAVAALACAALLAIAAPVDAQTCGDADASGAVTVTDGVQTLLAAAGLASTCGGGRCDVDGNGRVTVTDGVSVLRAAAGLTATLQCRVDITNFVSGVATSDG